MLKQESTSSTLCFKGCTTKARACDTCRSSPSAVFCRSDQAYLCTGCDARIHAANEPAHERVWVCEACEQFPAVFICKADAASLCATCDAEIHSANPLARRHDRVPVVPILGPLYGPTANEEEDEAASWLMFDDTLLNQNANGVSGNGEEGVDEYLDLAEYNRFSDDQYTIDVNNNSNSISSNNIQQNRGYMVPDKEYVGGDADSVVPIRFEEAKKHDQVHFLHTKFELGMEYETSNGGSGYSTSLGHGVSMSSLDGGVVPDSTIIELSISNARASKGTIDLFSNPSIQMPTQLTPMDREARVLRYKEKKKTRKFEKTIRYASRKAYAETRPRIKGRFAKRSNVDVEAEQTFSTSLTNGGGFCIVPSF